MCTLTRLIVWQAIIVYASASASASSRIGMAIVPGKATALSGTSELAILLSGEQCSVDYREVPKVWTYGSVCCACA